MAHQVLDRNRTICRDEHELVRIGFGVGLVVGRDLHFGQRGYVFPNWLGAFELRAREETRESRGMPCLFLNTERGFGRKTTQKIGVS